MAPNGTKLGAWTVNSASDTYGPAADFDGDGHAELLVTGSSGMAILKLVGASLTTIMIATNETFLGGWRLRRTSITSSQPLILTATGRPNCF